MRRREGDGCPVWGVLQVVGDKWTLLIVRDLAGAPRRTTELLARLHPISSRTLMDRLRDMEHDALIERRDLGGSPRRDEVNMRPFKHNFRKTLALAAAALLLAAQPAEPRTRAALRQQGVP